jgi:sugar (pentulose or hexulose) kinase
MELNLEKTALGIEFGSTNIKAVLIDENYQPVASGSYGWENRLENGLWTYDLDDVWSGLQQAYAKLVSEVKRKYGLIITQVGSIGFSGMMHGYLAFDKEGNQLVPFRTWRNTNTETAVKELTKLFQFNIPHRWSIAHLYQALLDREEHIKEVEFVTTLAGYVHWQLTGEKVVGIGEASGMFPIDSETRSYDSKKVKLFNEQLSKFKVSWDLEEIFPEVLSAGERAGELSEQGALLLDPTGTLKAGIPFAPPEGDAGTGMVATNTVAERTGNVSAGTSIFSMFVLEKELSTYYEEIDMVTTPTGKPVAMVHCNNFTTDINSWARLFKEVASVFGAEVDEGTLFSTLFTKALEADDDCGQLVSCNYYSGEPITGFDEGRPLFIQKPDSKLTLPNFMLNQIYSALATLKLGSDILTQKEHVSVDYLLGHGGFFKTKDVGQKYMANAINVPVSVMDTAGEGGPWGMAILASFILKKKESQSLEEYLSEEVFSAEKPYTVYPDEKGREQFEEYMNRYQSMLEVERKAVKVL